MAGEVVERQAKGGKKGLRRQKRRIAIRIDMTPMVDIAFLLLIFYMVTTVFAMPQAMEINLPPAEEMDQIVEVKESNLLSIYVDEEGRYWWGIGNPAENLPQLIPSNPDAPDTAGYAFNADSLRSLLVERNRDNAKLNTLVVINRDATYADLVNILDEIDVIERSWNKFKADELGVKVDELPKDEKFSYRYAIGDWEPRHTKIIAEAHNQAVQNGELGG